MNLKLIFLLAFLLTISCGHSYNKHPILRRIKRASNELYRHRPTHQNCEDLKKDVERREESANVIFTGTVKGIYDDFYHPGMYKGEVEIKRVFKGENEISVLGGLRGPPSFYRRKVIIEGFGDPHICFSDVRRYDTRIFMVTKMDNGELRLNSSLMRVTLNNLDKADAAVKDEPFQPVPRPTPSPCEIKFCAFGAACRVNEGTGEAECVCKEKCNDIFAPVCGSDLVTYTSECHLRAAACSQQKRIKMKSAGTCDVKDPCKEKECSFGAQCVPSIDGLTARCQCPQRCDSYGDSVGSKPVCGTDGHDYPTQCEMRKAACSEMKDIGVKYFGKCDPCDGYSCPVAQVCQLDKERTPICRCNSLCTLEFAPVCGSDGRTYSNECIMKVEACKNRKEIRVLFHGECTSRNNPCNSLQCGPGEECHVDRNGAARCECPPPCEPVLRPVCGSDLRTYDNECELRRQSCLSKKMIQISYYDECAINGPCAVVHCEFGGMCVVRNQLPTCECPTCSVDYRPVCGSDGITYDNECKLKAESCAKRKLITVKYQGLCNGCENKQCDHYAMCESDGNGSARCVCPSSCIQVEDRVCGTDGKTYLNECELRVSSCTKQQYITISSSGPCGRCDNVKCRYGARCENGKCVCPQSCPEMIQPVCANDGRTYNNDCELRRSACVQGVQLEVVHSGECDDISSGSGAIEICDETTCRFGGTCDYDAEGSHGCVCNFACDAIRSPVCGSDGVLYGNECQMREQACKRQVDITIRPADTCEAMDEEICDGNVALVNSLTGRDYDCENGRETCPAGSYCHHVKGMAKCCQEDQTVRSCTESRYGCCPDGRTSAPGPNNAGCPSICQCHPLGAYSRTCDPQTSQCTCKPGVGGRRCDRCEPGFWGLPRIAEGNSGCTPCGCNIFGSVRDDCEQMTGRCVCKPGVTGQKCNICPNGKELGPQGCTDHAVAITSCDFMTCRYGAKCHVINGVAECLCHDVCDPMDEQPITVCGTDSKTYGSECQLKLFSCRLQQFIRVAYQGACQDTSTTASPYYRGRKTTRHIHGKVTRHIMPPTASTPEYGFIGDFCSNNEDCLVENSHCKSNLCQCQNGFSPSDDNLFCLVPLPTKAAPPETLKDSCLKRPCKNKGSCEVHMKKGFICVCPLGYSGNFCEDETSFTVPSFAGKSYLEFRKLHHANRELSIEMEFKTLNNDGILLYSAQQANGQGDYIALSVKDGHVQFRFDLGSGMLLLETPEKVVLNTFHKVRVRRFGQDGTLQLDEGEVVSASSPGTLKSLNLGTPLYLGYVPDATPIIFGQIGEELGLVGCIESLKVESKDTSKEYDLMYPGSRDIIGGSGIGECGENPCQSLPCQHAGTCLNVGPNFICSCIHPWTGATCEIDITRVPCEPNPCVAGGVCAVLPGARFACRCPIGRDGQRCEKEAASGITVPEFRGDSFLELKLQSQTARYTSFEIWFLTRDANGVILYAAQDETNKGDFISLNLVNGFLQFRYDLGSGIANITSTKPVALNMWHRVDISRINRFGTLVVNTEQPIRGSSEGNLNELNLASTVYLGGYAGDYNPNAGISSNFKGAIQRVNHVLDDEHVVYEDSQVVEEIYQGAVSVYNVGQYMGPPCPKEDNPCLNGGMCIPQLNDYECKCAQGYDGKKCDRVAVPMDTSLPVAFDGKTSHRYMNKLTHKERSQEENKFEVKFRTMSRSGLLLIQHKTTTIQGDYVALAINKGRVEASYNLGKQGLEDLHIITSDKLVNDGEWHTVIFNREKRKGTLIIDGHMAMSDVSEQGATQLDTDGSLWIGGARRMPVDLPDSYQRGFNGCIAFVKVDGEQVKLVEQRENHQPVEFCDA